MTSRSAGIGLHRLSRQGGRAASDGNPRPYGMPPYATILSDREVAAVLTTSRNSWGHGAAPVNTVDVQGYRGGSASGG